MTWQQEAVQAWRDWQKIRSNEFLIIPPYQQVGKILEFCLCDETRVVEFIDGQIEDDRRPNMHSRVMADNYWPSVKRTFYEIQVNQIIMAD